jgi:hypothetical protein
MRILLVLAVGLPLAGCFSVTGPKPLPEWAMSPQDGDAYVEPQPRRKAAARQRAPEVAREQAAPADNRTTDAARPSNTQSAGLTRAVVRRKPTALQEANDPIPTAPELRAHDVDADRVVNSICRGC